MAQLELLLFETDLFEVLPQAVAQGPELAVLEAGLLLEGMSLLLELADARPVVALHALVDDLVDVLLLLLQPGEAVLQHPPLLLDPGELLEGLGIDLA